VFPVGPDKTPLTEHGFKDASPISSKFDWSKAAGVAFAVPDDIIVIDIDPRNGGDESVKILRDNGCDPVGDTLVAATAGGGTHAYYKYDGEEKLKGKLAPGIDVKLPGRGYVILPPSFNGGYRWRNETDILPLPGCILDRLKRGGVVEIDDGFKLGSQYGRKALESELGRMAIALEGERNETLNKAAYALGQLVAGGELTASVIDKLRTVAERTGLDDEEINGTLQSGYLAGMRQPRSAPEKPIPKTLRRGLPAFVAYTPERIKPVRRLIYKPFLYERALTWMFGPSGSGKSIVLDHVASKLSRAGERVLMFDWEAPELEVERLQSAESDWSNVRILGMNPEDPLTFGVEGFREEIMAQVEDMQPALVVFNTFTAMYGEVAAADGWNAPVREVGVVAREIADHGPAVVVTDHQEDPKAVKAHGGSSKKAWADLYLRVTQDGDEKWRPGEPYFLLIENLKSSREFVPTSRGTVRGGRGFDGPLWITWEII